VPLLSWRVREPSSPLERSYLALARTQAEPPDRLGIAFRHAIARGIHQPNAPCGEWDLPVGG